MRNRIITSILLVLFVLSALSFAQDGKKQESDYDLTAEIELLKTDLKAQKIALFSNGMELTKAQGEKFWPVFNEYQEETGKLVDLKIKLYKEYAKSYEKMTDKKANKLLAEAMDIDKKTAKLKEKYIIKMKKILPAVEVVRFYQLDHRIKMLINLQISSVIPLIK